MVDEIGRGTSSKDGASLAGALLEALGDIGVSGIFSTHLHEVLQLPIDVRGLQYKKMGWETLNPINHVSPISPISRVSTPESTLESQVPHVEGSVESYAEVVEIGAGVPRTAKWTYTLEDGVCVNSMGLETAAAYQIPAKVIARAAQLATHFDQLVRAAPETASTGVTGACGSGSGSSGSNGSNGSNGRGMDMGLGGNESINSDYEENEETTKTKTKTVNGLVAEDSGLEESDGVENSIYDPTRTEVKAEVKGYSLDSVIPLLRSLGGVSADGVVVIDDGNEPQGSLAGNSCVYALLVCRRDGSAPDCFYIGETDSVHERMKAHRAQTFAGCR